MESSHVSGSQSCQQLPAYVKKLHKPLADFTDILLKHGEDDVKKALKPLDAPPTPPSDSERQSILSAYKSWELHELGLGRGINGNDPRPWINKSSFQVRSTDGDKKKILIGTNEGSMLRDFVEEVTSIKNQTAKFDVSIKVPNAPVTIGVGADLSRTMTNTQKAFGRQILTKTIAFQPLLSGPADTLAKEVLECTEGRKDGEDCHDFEKILCGKDERVKYFEAFFKRYNITHYVSSITLGASMFIVEAESEYHRKINHSSKLEYEPIASLEASAVFSKKLTSESKDIKYIGKFTGKNLDEVEEEAVVSIQVKPISTLFENEVLRKAIAEALERYRDYQKQKTTGPFFISCYDSKIYLKVDEVQEGHAQVFGVDREDQASKFYIYLTDDGDNPYEFYIGWKSSDDKGTIRYLNAPMSLWGTNDGPLCVESHGTKHSSLFSLNNPLTDPYYRLRGDVNVNPEPWLKGNESFLVRCTRRRFRYDGFLALREQTQQERADYNGHKYRTICKLEATCHDDVSGHMVFRLHHTLKETD